MNENKKSSLLDATYRKGIFGLGLLILVFGIFNHTLLLIGVLTWLIGLTLFLSDSWGLYFIIYLMWAFGGLLGLANINSLFSLLMTLLVTFFGFSYIIILATNRKQNNEVKGRVDI